MMRPRECEKCSRYRSDSGLCRWRDKRPDEVLETCVYESADGIYEIDETGEIPYQSEVVKCINRVIDEAVSHGGDYGGVYYTNEEGLKESLEELAKQLGNCDVYMAGEFRKGLFDNNVEFKPRMPKLKSIV